MRMGPVTRKGPLALPAPKAALKANCAAAILQAATSADVQLEGEMETLMKSLVGGLFKTVPKQAKDHQVVEAAVVQIFDAATSAAETPAAELALYMASNYGNSPLLMHRLVCPCTAHVFSLACTQLFELLMWHHWWLHLHVHRRMLVSCWSLLPERE